MFRYMELLFLFWHSVKPTARLFQGQEFNLIREKKCYAGK